METTYYDRKSIYEEKVKPLVNQIEEICRLNGIPFFFTAAVKNSADGTEYVNKAMTALPMNIYLKDDKLVEHVKVSAGFEVVVPDHIPDIEF